jgi:hypothetical protein
VPAALREIGGDFIGFTKSGSVGAPAPTAAGTRGGTGFAETGLSGRSLDSDDRQNDDFRGLALRIQSFDPSDLLVVGEVDYRAHVPIPLPVAQRGSASVKRIGSCGN